MGCGSSGITRGIPAGHRLAPRAAELPAPVHQQAKWGDLCQRQLSSGLSQGGWSQAVGRAGGQGQRQLLTCIHQLGIVLLLPSPLSECR